MFELTKEKLEDWRCQIGTSNRVPTMFDSRSDDMICSAPLFRAGPDKLSVVICANLCPFEVPKAREVFDTLGFKVCDFSTSVSKT